MRGDSRGTRRRTTARITERRRARVAGMDEAWKDRADGADAPAV